jgi:hypothetical protein
MVILCAALLIAVSFVLAQTSIAIPALAQTETEYKSSYAIPAAEASTPLTVQLEHHLYNPGDEVTLRGSVWMEIVNRVDNLDLVKIEVKDSKGNIVVREDASVESDGNYSKTFMLLENAEKGTYTLEASIEIDADALGIVQAITSAALQSSIQFAVASPVEHNVNAENQNFTVYLASNSGVNDFQFRQEEKRVSFFVEGDADTNGMTEITIPKKLLSGKMTVLIDQNVVVEDSVLLKSDTGSETILEINYKHSIHRVEVAGTNVVPEFPMVPLVLAVTTLASIITISLMNPRARRMT